MKSGLMKKLLFASNLKTQDTTKTVDYNYICMFKDLEVQRTTYEY